MDRVFEEFFKRARGSQDEPYHYQECLATEAWPDVVNIPTAMGKTASIVLSWLYKRTQNDSGTPRRLVYCLPMRVLVEQTVENVSKWVRNLVESGSIPPNRKPSIQVLMGGELYGDWDTYPEQDTVLIGTQDQLLSRALNRGYGMSRFRWPVHFGLLNNDCLWVLDEVQLMGSGLATSVQLQAFRNLLGTVLPVHSVWMSATLKKSWLKTIDFDPGQNIQRELTLTGDDLRSSALRRRLKASKPLIKADCPSQDIKKIAKLVLSSHTPGNRTLAIVNTVKRAADLYEEVKRKKPSAQLSLLHSRFRPSDRTRCLERLLSDPPKEGTICISTQVVEAGVDVSCSTLITDLAPWASLVQRFGRCNREGVDNDAKIFWLELDMEKKGALLPYSHVELSVAASMLQKIHNARPKTLPETQDDFKFRHLLRKKDVIDLFDTTPDLAGADIDISRFIRETKDHDVQVFWRDLPKEGPEKTEPGPSREELCSISIGDLRSIKDLELWRWDHLQKGWAKPQDLFPGLVLMLRREAGCYSSEKGWTGNKTDIPDVVCSPESLEESNDDDLYSQGIWQSLPSHSNGVIKELEEILSACLINDPCLVENLILAAVWHDVGKGHEVFQKAMTGDPPEANPSVLWAKTTRKSVKYERRGFRHELASALAIIEHGLPDLAAYLAASHHGKVRLSIRSLPNETKPVDPNIRFARGIWDGDILPEVELAHGTRLPRTVMDLSYMEFGDGPKGPSWLSRMLALRDRKDLGPFRLALLEALLRASDWRASGKATENGK